MRSDYRIGYDSASPAPPPARPTPGLMAPAGGPPMARDARKKQKHRLKRQQKQREVRKAAAVTPFQKVVKSGGELECYVNGKWREQGMASVQVLGHAPGGRRFGYAA